MSARPVTGPKGPSRAARRVDSRIVGHERRFEDAQK